MVSPSCLCDVGQLYGSFEAKCAGNKGRLRMNCVWRARTTPFILNAAVKAPTPQTACMQSYAAQLPALGYVMPCHGASL
jgi:hypothetical protein